MMYLSLKTLERILIRNYIKGEKEQFKKDIDTIFVKVGVSNEKIDN